MDERYKDMLRAMQMARARAREVGQSQLAVHQAGSIAPQEQDLQKQTHQQTQRFTNVLTMEGPSPETASRTDAGEVPSEVQVVQRMDRRTDGTSSVAAAELGLASPRTATRKDSAPEPQQYQDVISSMGENLSQRIQRQQQMQDIHQYQHVELLQNHQVPSPGQPLRTMEAHRQGQQLVLDLSRRASDDTPGTLDDRLLPVGPPLLLDSPGHRQQSASISETEDRRQKIAWQQQQQQQQIQQQQLLLQQHLERLTPSGITENIARQLEPGRQGMVAERGWTLRDLPPQQQQELLINLQEQQHQQQRSGQVSVAQLQAQSSDTNDIAAAVASLLQSRKRPQLAGDPEVRILQQRVGQQQLNQREAQPERLFSVQKQQQDEVELHRDLNATQQQQQLQLQQQLQQRQLHISSRASEQEFGDRSGGCQVVDLTTDEDAGSEGAGTKRRLPAPFLQGGTALKRPASGLALELAPGDGAGGGTRPDVKATVPHGRRLPPSLAAAASGGDGDGHYLQLPLQLQRQPQQGDEPRQRSVQEQQLLLHMDTVRTRLREGTLPVGHGKTEVRLMTAEERTRFEEAALKLHRQIDVLQKERRQLMQVVQQQQPQEQQQQQKQKHAWPEPTMPQQQLGSRAMYGFPPVTTGMPVGRADRFRGQTNGSSQAKGPFPSMTGTGALVGVTGSSGVPGSAAAGKSLSGPVSSPKESVQNRVTEHQQALRAVIESLQVSGNEELEPPPKSLQVTVLRHQRMALAWMIRRETGSEPRGGILADDQGLGKTVTTISLIVTHTNPEDCGQRRGEQQSQQRQVEVVELEDDDEDDDELGVEDEGEEDVDACGVRMGALRAEWEAAGAAGAAAMEGAAVDMLQDAESGDGTTAAGLSPGQVALTHRMRGAATGTGACAGAGGSASVEPSAHVKTDGGSAAAMADVGQAVAISLQDDDDDDNGDDDDGDSPLKPHKFLTVPSGPGTGAWNCEPDILSITDGPSAVAGASALPSSLLSLPPTAAGSLSQLASSNLAASAATSTAVLMASHGQKLAVPSAGAHGSGGGSGHKLLYESEPPNLVLGGSLVVCPTSVLHQWAREIRDKVSPTAGLVVHVYHGKDRASDVRQLAAMGVVLTTYGTLAQEAPSRDKQAVRMGRQGTSNAPINLAADDSGAEEQGALGVKGRACRSRSKPLTDPAGGPLYQIKWKRVVLDEAQSIKNPRTLAAHAAWRLFAHCRWCLSGTPIQNTVDDLYSYFRFLRYAPYCESRKFKELIKVKIAEKPEIGYKFLQAVLQAVLLRRTKQSKINGEPIIKLPAREQQLIKVKFSGPEAAFYSQVQAESLRAINEASHGGVSGSRQYVNMLHSLLKLRQACNHPWLVRGARNTWHKTGTPSASEVETARKLSPEARSVLVAALSRGDAQCPCCGDIAEDPVASSCGHVFCAQCLAAQKEGVSVEGELLCPACSRLLRGSDLHSAAALAAVDPSAALAKASSGLGGGSDAGGGSNKSGGGQEWVSSAKIERLLSLLEGIRSKNRDQGPGKAGPSSAVPAKSKSDKLMAGALRKLPPLPSAGAGTSYGGTGGRPDKVIIFSQWTSMLDLLEIPLKKAKIHFRRLDGTMTVANRERAIQDFESKLEVMVLLVSLKAAALGINLTVANHVVLMDLWWNPTTEEQAIDRAHRIGQTRTVHITRITIAGSVEDRILELQQAKREVVAAALSEGRDGNAAAVRLTLDDLRFLFQGLSQ